MYLGIFSINDVIHFRANTVDRSGSALDASVGPDFQVFTNDDSAVLASGIMNKVYSEEGTYEGSFTALEDSFLPGQYFILLDATVDSETPKAHIAFQLVSDDLSLEETFQEIQMIGLSIPIVGEGTISIDHNFGAVDNYRVTSSGTPLADVDIRAFVKSDYDAGRRANKYIVGQSKTKTDGRWVSVIRLDPGNYVLEFSKPGQYRTATVNVTITSDVGVMSFSNMNVQTMSVGGMVMEPCEVPQQSLQSFSDPTPSTPMPSTPMPSVDYKHKGSVPKGLPPQLPQPSQKQRTKSFSTPTPKIVHVDHNYKGKDNLRLVSKGKPVAGADIKIYKKKDYDDGHLSEKFVVQRTITAKDGRWEHLVKLKINEDYVIEFGKKGEYSSSVQSISVGAAGLYLQPTKSFSAPLTETVQIDHNYEGKDSLRLISGSRAIVGADIKIYKKKDYDAGRLSEEFVIQRTITSTDGRWEHPIRLQVDENYVIEFEKKGKYASNTKVIRL